MKKSILNLGKALNKAEQKQISGGAVSDCAGHYDLCFRSGQPYLCCVKN
jgi:hypothetical protein